MADESDNSGGMMLQVIGVAVTAVTAIGAIWTMRRRRAAAAAASSDADKSASGSGGRVLASRIKANGGQWPPPKKSRSRNSSMSSNLSGGGDKPKKVARSPRNMVGRGSVRSLAGVFDQKTADANSVPSAQRKSTTMKTSRVASHQRKLSNSKSSKYNSATLPPNATTSSSKPVAAAPVRKAKIPTVKRSSAAKSTLTSSSSSSSTPTVTPAVRKAKIPSMKRAAASSSSAPSERLVSSSTASSRARSSISRTAKVPSQASASSSSSQRSSTGAGAANGTGAGSTLRKKRTAVGSSATRTVKPSSPESKKSEKSSMGCTSSKSPAVAVSSSAPTRRLNRGTKAKAPTNGVNSSSGSTSRGKSVRKSAATKPSANSSTNPDTTKPVNGVGASSSSTGSSPHPHASARPKLTRALTNSIRCHLCLARIADVDDESAACSFEGNWFHADCFKCQRCGVSLSSDTCELFELLGPLCTKHAKALKNSKKKLRKAVRAITAAAAVAASSKKAPKSKPAPTASSTRPTPLVVKGDTFEEYVIDEVDAEADEDMTSLFDDIMASHIEDGETSSEDSKKRPVRSSRTPDILATPNKKKQSTALHGRTKSALPFTPMQRRQITEESEKFFSEEMFCKSKTSPKTKDGRTKLRCFRCSDHRNERVSVETSRRLISLGYPTKVEFCSGGDCFACLKCSESLHTVLEQRGMKGISVSPFGAVCTSCVTFSMEEAGEE